MKKVDCSAPATPDRYLSMADVCSLSGYCRRTVMLALAEKRLRGSRNHSLTGQKGRWRIRQSQVELWMKSMEV